MSTAAALRPADPLLRLPEVKREVGLSKTTIYRKVADGSFPPPQRISKRAVAWRFSRVEAWKAAQPLTNQPLTTEN